jgi:hypothetical protein
MLGLLALSAGKSSQYIQVALIWKAEHAKGIPTSALELR